MLTELWQASQFTLAFGRMVTDNSYTGHAFPACPQTCTNVYEQEKCLVCEISHMVWFFWRIYHILDTNTTLHAITAWPIYWQVHFLLSAQVHVLLSCHYSRTFHCFSTLKTLDFLLPNGMSSVGNCIPPNILIHLAATAVSHVPRTQAFISIT